ncbi:MAG TPA: response regulator, partial [Kofleriaceae bacterium]|nr:response regulator [Kofleriaceae bacterium]
MSSATLHSAAAVLVVDDESETASLLRDLLVKRGYRADAVTSGAACLEYLRDNPVDVVVADVQMPGMSGIQLCEHLYVRFPDVAPIVLTGYGRLDT